MRKEERQRQLFFRMMTAGLEIAAVVMIKVTIVTVKRHKEEETVEEQEITDEKNIDQQPQLDVE